MISILQARATFSLLRRTPVVWTEIANQIIRFAYQCHMLALSPEQLEDVSISRSGKDKTESPPADWYLLICGFIERSEGGLGG